MEHYLRKVKNWTQRPFVKGMLYFLFYFLILVALLCFNGFKITNGTFIYNEF